MGEKVNADKKNEGLEASGSRATTSMSMASLDGVNPSIRDSLKKDAQGDLKYKDVPGQLNYSVFCPRISMHIHVAQLVYMCYNHLCAFLHIRDSYEDENMLNRSFTLPWQQIVSILLLKLMQWINQPLRCFGILLEFILNAILANGGIMQTLLHLVLFWEKRLILRWRDDANFSTILAIMDQRCSLLRGGALGGLEMGSRVIADLCVMASKLAYENENHIRRVVSFVWKMNFIGYFDCWNEYHKEADTQVFLFTDRPTDAQVIVLSFRGTEPFNALDWSTDFDFSWFELPRLGKVHVGFLEALGLGDRKSMETFSLLKKKAQVKGRPIFKFLRNVITTAKLQNSYHFSGLSNDVLKEPAKVLAYDDMTTKVKNLLEEHPHAKLLVTGHSLGGALAALYSTLLFYNDETTVTGRLGAVYTFGQPRIGDEKFSHYMINKFTEARYFRVVYSNDVVPRIPFDDKLFKYKHSGLCYYFNARYDGETLREAPHANFFCVDFVRRFIVMRIIAFYELIRSLVLFRYWGLDYQEPSASIVFRVLGLLIPGIAAHGMTNYINAIRLGRTPLLAEVSTESGNMQHTEVSSQQQD